MRIFNRGNRRFYVMDISGWPITPSTGLGNTTRNSSTTYAVCDRDNLHLEVARFIDSTGPNYWTKTAATLLAAELNLRHEDKPIPLSYPSRAKQPRKATRACANCGCIMYGGRWLQYGEAAYSCWPGDGCNAMEDAA